MSSEEAEFVKKDQDWGVYSYLKYDPATAERDGCKHKYSVGLGALFSLREGLGAVDEMTDAEQLATLDPELREKAALSVLEDGLQPAIKRVLAPKGAGYEYRCYVDIEEKPVVTLDSCLHKLAVQTNFHYWDNSPETLTYDESGVALKKSFSCVPWVLKKPEN